MIERALGVVEVGADRGVLLERETELAVARAALEQAHDGHGSGLLIQGPAGVGKSRLMAEIAALASARGMTVLRARGGTLERGYSFGVVRQLLGPTPLLDAEPGPATAADADCATLDALCRALARLTAESPVLVSVDDAQWLDTPSMRLLEFLSRRLENLPLVLLIAGHPGSDGTPDHVLAGLQAGRLLTPLAPAPLSADGAAALVACTFTEIPAADFAAACHRRTGGNPFFLVELLRECAALGLTPDAPEAATRVSAMAPRTVGAVVKARLTRLGHTEALAAQALATLGDGAELADVAALAGLRLAVAAAAVGALAGAGFLAGGDRLAFAHPLVSEVIRSDVPAVRAQRHMDAARLLHARGRDPEAVAAHVALSPRAADDWNVARLREAARLAVARSAPDLAVALLRRAVAEPPAQATRAEVLAELGTVQATLEPETAIRSLTEARDSLAPGAERAAVGLRLSRLLVLTGRPAPARDAVTDARANLTPADREPALALDAVELTTHPETGGATRHRSALSQASTLTGATAGERAVLAAAAWQSVRGLAPQPELRELLGRAVGAGRCAGEAADPLTPAILATALAWSGQLQASVDLASARLEQAAAVGATAAWADAAAARAEARWAAGQLADAEADARRALAAPGSATGHGHALAVRVLVGVLTDTGRLDQARAEADALENRAPRPGTALAAGVACARAGLDLARGDHAAALTRATAAGRALEAAGCRHPAGGEWRHLAALAQLGLGRRAEAAAVLAPALAAARRSGGAYELGLSLRVAALVERPVSLERLGEAREVVAGSEFRLLHAEVLVDLGSALRRGGRRREAREPLAEAMEIASAAGAVRLAERAQVELLAAGSRPRRVERTGCAALTPSERRTAALAVDGLSNREIAQQLYVSVRTVESQLRSAYQKLGIASRDQLREVLGGRVATPALA